jgi:hypothetical protein
MKTTHTPQANTESQQISLAVVPGKLIPKYTSTNLIPIFLEAAAFRNKMIDLGFTDNGGAIHSAERILDILGLRLRYPGLSHINNYRSYADAEFSVNARLAYERGETVLIEHVSPIRDFTRKAIELVSTNSSGNADKLTRFVKENYRLVLLTPDETKSLNRVNRSRMALRRLEDAGISMP